MRIGVLLYFLLVAAAFTRVPFLSSLRLPGIASLLPPTTPHGPLPLGPESVSTPAPTASQSQAPRVGALSGQPGTGAVGIPASSPAAEQHPQSADSPARAAPSLATQLVVGGTSPGAGSAVPPGPATPPADGSSSPGKGGKTPPGSATRAPTPGAAGSPSDTRPVGGRSGGPTASRSR